MQIRLLLSGWDPQGQDTMRAFFGACTDEPTLRVVDTPPFDLLLLACDNLERAVTQLAMLRAAGRTPGRVLAVCSACIPAELTVLVKHGVNGCIQPDASTSAWSSAVRGVAGGEDWFPRRVLVQALRGECGVRPIEVASQQAQLTHREGEIMRLIGLGLTNKEIGRQLEISDQTVKTHLHRVYAKLHQSGRFKAYLAQPGESLQKR